MQPGLSTTTSFVSVVSLAKGRSVQDVGQRFNRARFLDVVCFARLLANGWLAAYCRRVHETSFETNRLSPRERGWMVTERR